MELSLKYKGNWITAADTDSELLMLHLIGKKEIHYSQLADLIALAKAHNWKVK